MLMNKAALLNSGVQIIIDTDQENRVDLEAIFGVDDPVVYTLIFADLTNTGDQIRPTSGGATAKDNSIAVWANLHPDSLGIWVIAGNILGKGGDGGQTERLQITGGVPTNYIVQAHNSGGGGAGWNSAIEGGAAGIYPGDPTFDTFPYPAGYQGSPGSSTSGVGQFNFTGGARGNGTLDQAGLHTLYNELTSDGANQNFDRGKIGGDAIYLNHAVVAVFQGTGKLWAGGGGGTGTALSPNFPMANVDLNARHGGDCGEWPYKSVPGDGDDASNNNRPGNAVRLVGPTASFTVQTPPVDIIRGDIGP